jgi:hypothetical protein
MRIVDNEQQFFHAIERVVSRGEQVDRFEGARDLHDPGECCQRHVPGGLGTQDEMGAHPAADEPFSDLARQRRLADTGFPDENDTAE